MDNNNEKAITFDNIEFRPSKAYPSSRHADLFLDNGLCANIFEDHKDGEDNIRYVISLSKDDEYIDFSLPSICERTNNIDAKSKDELIKILNVASQITEDDIFDPLDDYVVENNNKAITFDDLEFRPSKAYPSSRHADLFLDNGLCANIFENHKDGEDNIRYVISLSKDDEYIDFSLPSICERTNNIDAKSEDELIKILNVASQITEDDIFDPLDDYVVENNSEDENKKKSKQSLEKIMAYKRSVSGVYVADKIGEAMRSGVVSETVTPEKGKQLSDNIKKKYIMDRQQKS